MFNLTIEVPTRRGGVLRGLHYAPDFSPAPTVLSLTPYGADRFHRDGMRFAAHGFNFVSLDVRGRGDSDGRFTPFVSDGADGHDAVEWLGERPWCTGDVVTYGGSYGGFVQWAVAATGPSHLRAIAPVAAVYPGLDFPMVRNVPLRYTVRWLTLVDGRRKNEGPHADQALWHRASHDQINGNRPYRDLDLLAVGRRLPVFQEWLLHPCLDAYWARLVPTQRQYGEITVPVLTITGQYDDDQLGALRYHDEHIAAVPPEVADRHRVVIGPWDHDGTRSGARTFGGLTFAPESAIDLIDLHVQWYGWVLGKASRPDFLRKRVAYFHAGEDQWRSADAIPQGRGSMTLYPMAERPAASHYRELSTCVPSNVQDTELSADPREAAAPDREEPLPDQCFVLPALPPDDTGTALVYACSPLRAAMDVSGRFRAHLVLSSELPDFDLLVGLYLVRADGTIPLLGETVFRARYRDTLTRSSPWPAGTNVPVTLTDFPFVSQRIEPGERVALIIRPPHRYYQTNFQAGGRAIDETARDAVPGTIRLVQNPDHVSYVEIPIDDSAARPPV
ncbi:CocE/NonD family hydrolase [Actinomadura rubrisoli]|uniref:CocE/NonD family hydrolase n=1 Tax=Actinomadura rubrisoli TaxID=2530368 RepID=A0A4R5C695_9ACTN|nr:CocE/NonD family hydrolase [Actinomadura rubrisoli]TDD95291.1 CocE/NonD family hydrolase [Actinomadura rubrisoli]